MSDKNGKKSKAEKTPISALPPSYPVAQELEKLFNEYLEIFRKFSSHMSHSSLKPSELWESVSHIRSPFVDVADHGNCFIVTAELPGFEKENVDVNVGSHYMKVRAERRSQKEELLRDYLEKERIHSSFYRIVTFPEEVDASKVRATMKNGVLEVELEKKAPKPIERPRKIKID